MSTAWLLGLLLIAGPAAVAWTYQRRIRKLMASESRLRALVEQNAAEVHERAEELRVANDMLADLATVDVLTRLANRRRFDMHLSQEWLRARRMGTPLSLLLVDVDHFKQFNDTNGHQAGDECLRQVGAALRECVRRAADLAARFGGEEFAIILPDTPAEGARVVAESIRTRVAAAGIVTVSVGITTAVPHQLQALSEMIAACDRALYRAKTEGRDRCVTV